MPIPTRITFRSFPPSEAVQARVRAMVAELERFWDRIQACHVVIEARHRHQRKGRLYHVRVELDLPGRNVVVNREPDLDHSHEDVYVAIRDAFTATTRQLEDHVRLMRRQTKRHEAPAHGRVVRLFAHKGYGFIEASDGRQIYFHRRSVVDGAFRRLREGMQVRFVTHDFEGDKGPQASTVEPMGKRWLPELEAV